MLEIAALSKNCRATILRQREFSGTLIHFVDLPRPLGRKSRYCEGDESRSAKEDGEPLGNYFSETI